MTKPAPRLCSKCGSTLQPQEIMENTYIFGHSCPAIIQKLNNEAQRIISNGFADQKDVRMALQNLQYQNTWAN